MRKINTKPLQLILRKYDFKKLQVLKLQAVTLYLTSADGCHLRVEAYNNQICRYIIKGTRSTCTVCFNTISLELCRKPRGEKPWYVNEDYNLSVSHDIIGEV